MNCVQILLVVVEMPTFLKCLGVIIITLDSGWSYLWGYVGLCSSLIVLTTKLLP